MNPIEFIKNYKFRDNQNNPVSLILKKRDFALINVFEKKSAFVLEKKNEKLLFLFYLMFFTQTKQSIAIINSTPLEPLDEYSRFIRNLSEFNNSNELIFNSRYISYFKNGSKIEYWYVDDFLKSKEHHEKYNYIVVFNFDKYELFQMNSMSYLLQGFKKKIIFCKNNRKSRKLFKLVDNNIWAKHD